MNYHQKNKLEDLVIFFYKTNRIENYLITLMNHRRNKLRDCKRNKLTNKINGRVIKQIDIDIYTKNLN